MGMSLPLCSNNSYSSVSSKEFKSPPLSYKICACNITGHDLTCMAKYKKI